MKFKSNVWMYGVVLVGILVAIVVLSLGYLQLQKESEEAVPPTPATDKGEEIMPPLYKPEKGGPIIIPEEHNIYKDYIRTIEGKPRVSDIGTIEATIMSITESEVCPYQEETCRIEPYPKDIGIVRIDKIINYTPYSDIPYSEQTIELSIEQPNGGELLEEGKNTSGYKDKELLKPKLSEYEPLQEGQEVSTHFLLTTSPAKIRYVPINEPKGGMESAQEPGNTNLGQDIGHVVTPGNVVTPEKKIFKPIPKDGNYYVFTTKIGKFPETTEKILPGLEVGSKFRAEIYYDGSLYVEEYEVIK